MGDVEGSFLVAGAALVAFQSTQYFTEGALNPTVILAIQFSQGTFGNALKILLSTFLGCLFAVMTYMILQSNEDIIEENKGKNEDNESKELMS